MHEDVATVSYSHVDHSHSWATCERVVPFDLWEVTHHVRTKCCVHAVVCQCRKVSAQKCPGREPIVQFQQRSIRHRCEPLVNERQPLINLKC
jgi:hypothetical protein